MIECKNNNECKEDPLLKSLKLNYVFYSALLVCLFIISYYTNSSFYGVLLPLCMFLLVVILLIIYLIQLI